MEQRLRENGTPEEQIAPQLEASKGEAQQDAERRVRMFFLLLVPIGFLAWLPASLMLGRIGPLAGILHTAWIVVLGLVVFRLWNRGFRRYESALG